MLANANPQLNEVPVDRSVREVIAVCAKNGIAYGELNSLVGFMRALKDNKQFAMNFWSLVARLSGQPADPANPEWLLAAIVEGVTAMPLAEVRKAGPAHRVLVDRLAKMLAGEDIQDPANDIPAAAATTPKLAPEPTADLHRQAAEPEPLEQPSRPERVRKSTVTDIEPITNPASIRDESLRLVLRPEPVITEVPEPSSANRRNHGLQLEHDRPIAIPLSSYAEDEPRNLDSGKLMIATAAVLVLGLCGFGIYRTGGTAVFGRLGSSIHAGYDSAVAAWKGTPVTPQTPPPAPASVTPSPAVTQPTATSSAPSSSAPESSAANPPPQPAATTPAAARVENRPAQQRARARGPIYYSRGPATGESMAATAASHQRHAEPPARVIPIPDVTSATPAPQRTGISRPSEQPSGGAPASDAGTPSPGTPPPSAMQQ